MIFQKTEIDGVRVVEPELKSDSRGFFARVFCARELREEGVDLPVAQGNLAFSHRRGTVRGLHYQVAPATETKLVRCVAGAIFDVLVDLRPGSPTFLQWVGVELSASNRLAVLVPPMVAHGYQCLANNSEVLYLVDQFYAPGMEHGVRFNDPAIGIKWPLKAGEVNARDMAWPLVESKQAGAHQ